MGVEPSEAAASLPGGNPDIASAVLGIFIRAVRTSLCATRPGAPSDAQVGALSFIHRFGSSLNAHLHFHVVVLDGVFSQAEGEEVRFHEAARLMPEHWHALQHVAQPRVLRHFSRYDLLDEAATHGMLSWQGSGGFSLDASVRIEGEDRAGVEPLLRYCARPPFALERLYARGGIVSLSSPDSKLVYRLPKPAPDVRTELVLSPLQLLERLARFVPPGTDANRWSRPPPPVPRCAGSECQTLCCRHVHRQARSRDTRRPAPEPKATALARC